MGYKEIQQLLIVNIEEAKIAESYFPVTHSNGAILRTNRGQRIGRVTKNDPPLQCYLLRQGQLISVPVYDKILAKRILMYQRDHYGQKVTNCASFAHFLFTGEFIECAAAENNMSFRHGMRPYDLQAKVDVGDVVCIIYANPRICGSRSSALRSLFQKARKRNRKNASFATFVPMRRSSYTAQEICRLSKTSSTGDYHFLTCIGKHQGEPVWISQEGVLHPGGQEAPFIISFGVVNPYSESEHPGTKHRYQRHRHQEQVSARLPVHRSVKVVTQGKAANIQPQHNRDDERETDGQKDHAMYTSHNVPRARSFDHQFPLTPQHPLSRQEVDTGHKYHAKKHHKNPI